MPLYRMDLTVTERHSFIIEAPNADKAEALAEAIAEYGMHEARDLYSPDRELDVHVQRATLSDRGVTRITPERAQRAVEGR